jgi:hypothetical protein
MQYLSGRACNGRVGCEVRGNVVWLTYPARDRKRRSASPLDSLKQSASTLTREIERSMELRTDIAAALDARRYELYRGSTSSGARATDCSLARAQGIHLSSLLRFVHTMAAAGADDRRGTSGPATQLDPLRRSLRELQVSLERTRALSLKVLAQCQRHD